MSMLCNLYRISPEQVAQLRASPDAVGELLGGSTPPPKVGLMSRLFGRAPKERPLSERRFEPITEDDTFELDQAWHILHYFFSGSAAEGAWPAAFILSGGEAIGPDEGYGPARLLTPDLSRDVAAFLGTQSRQALDAAYVPSEMEAAQIYWQAASNPTERRQQVDELWSVTQALRAFCARTAQAGHATLVSIY